MCEIGPKFGNRTIGENVSGIVGSFVDLESAEDVQKLHMSRFFCFPAKSCRMFMKSARKVILRTKDVDIQEKISHDVQKTLANI